MIKKLDWNEYHKYVDRLAEKIQVAMSKNESPIYRYIAGVDSDDMIVAVHLSHKLNLPVVTDLSFFSLLNNFADTTNVLVVSNVVKTGNTFKSIQNELNKNFDTAVLFKDKTSQYHPTYCVEIPDDMIYFPWQKCGIE